MKIIRFNTICSLPNVMKLEVHEKEGKKYDESIVDKSCFTPLSEQMKSLQPMTPSEQEQHFHFIDGKDTGMKAPLPPSADIAELSTAVRYEQKAVKDVIEKAVNKTKTDIANQQKAQKILNNIGKKE